MNGVLLVAPSAVLLEARRKEFARSMQEVLAQGQEQRATCHIGTIHKGGAHQSFKTPVLVQ